MIEYGSTLFFCPNWSDNEKQKQSADQAKIKYEPYLKKEITTYGSVLIFCPMETIFARLPANDDRTLKNEVTNNEFAGKLFIAKVSLVIVALFDSG